MFDNIDSFALSRDNTRYTVELYPFDSEPGTMSFGTKRQIVGNLMELDVIIIRLPSRWR
jgi:hypothetical protein